MKTFRIIAIMTIFAAVLMLGGCPPSGAPLAGFRATPTSGPAPLVVQFTDLSRTAKAAGIVSWSWDFGDGSGSAEQNPTHVYTTKGDYNVSLTATNDTGMTDTARQTRYIRVAAGSGGEEQTIMLPGDVPLVMVWIPGGTFMMGRYPGEQDSNSGEDPQHSVTVPGFWMGKYEVTQAQWRALLGTSPSYFSGDSRPVERVTWLGAKSFVTALNTHSGLNFRLPSEAEWEYACRAGATTRFYWGDDPDYEDINDYAWFWDNDMETYNVGTKLPNAFGLHDMSGNVWEWCEDDWHGSYTGAPTNGSAWVDSPRGSLRVARGGGWYYGGYYCRSAYRSYFNPSGTYYGVGFRLSR